MYFTSLFIEMFDRDQQWRYTALHDDMIMSFVNTETCAYAFIVLSLLRFLKYILYRKGVQITYHFNKLVILSARL